MIDLSLSFKWMAKEMIIQQINVKRIPKGQLKKDNPEKLTTQGTQDEVKQTKTQHNMCQAPLYTQTNTNNVIKT